MNNCFVIITAGGIGSRMEKAVPKQFLKVGTYPLLWHSIQQFHEALNPEKIIVTLPEDYIEYWNSLCHNEGLTLPHQVIPGGKERFHSVKQALKTIDREEGIIGIHDGVRPFVTHALINQLLEKAWECGVAIPALPLKDSIRQQEGNQWVARDRSRFRRVQTPQFFDLARLKTVYQTEWTDAFTDDAVVWEQSGRSVELVNGEESNIKITNDWDFEFAQFLAQKLENK